MVSKIDQMKYGVMNNLHEYKISNAIIAYALNIKESEVEEFLNR